MTPLDALVAMAVKGISGLATAFGLSLFWRPKAFMDRSPFVAGVLCGGIGTLSAIVFAGLLLEKIGLDGRNSEHVLAASGFAAILGLIVFNFLARWLKKHDDRDSDIGDVIRDGRDILGGGHHRD